MNANPTDPHFEIGVAVDLFGIRQYLGSSCMSGRLYGPMPAIILFPPLYTVNIINTEKSVGDRFPLPEGIPTYIRSIQDLELVCFHADTVAILAIPLRKQGLEKNEHMASTKLQSYESRGSKATSVHW